MVSPFTRAMQFSSPDIAAHLPLFSGRPYLEYSIINGERKKAEIGLYSTKSPERNTLHYTKPNVVK
jgi:hypothetical protein